MRQNDPPNVFRSATCAAGCGSPWAKWCRGCNLVYCGRHIEHKAHKCKRLDLKRGAGLFPDAPKPQKKRTKAPAAPPNGTAQLPLPEGEPKKEEGQA